MKLMSSCLRKDIIGSGQRRRRSGVLGGGALGWKGRSGGGGGAKLPPFLLDHNGGGDSPVFPHLLPLVIAAGRKKFQYFDCLLFRFVSKMSLEGCEGGGCDGGGCDGGGSDGGGCDGGGTTTNRELVNS